MTGAALLNLSCVIKRVTAKRGTIDEPLKAELRRAFVAAVPAALAGEPLPVTPLERLDAALAECHKAGIDVRDIAEQRFGASSLLSLMARD